MASRGYTTHEAIDEALLEWALNAELTHPSRIREARAGRGKGRERAERCQRGVVGMIRGVSKVRLRRTTVELSGRIPWLLGILGAVYALAGRGGEARDILAWRIRAALGGRVRLSGSVC